MQKPHQKQSFQQVRQVVGMGKERNLKIPSKEQFGVATLQDLPTEYRYINCTTSDHSATSFHAPSIPWVFFRACTIISIELPGSAVLTTTCRLGLFSLVSEMITFWWSLACIIFLFVFLCCLVVGKVGIEFLPGEHSILHHPYSN
jgi:hypothetical protein